MAKMQFLKARWVNLVMINYEVDPDILKLHLPAATVLDVWQGKVLVSMVGFMFMDTSVFGVRWPGHVNFEEVNLRFYVKHFDGEVWKRGAVFVSEIVPKGVIAVIANNLYKEHYRALPMRHSVNPVSDTHTQYLYEWKFKGRWNKLGGSVNNTLQGIRPNSAEEFIFEHYWGYNRVNAIETREYQVEHISWQTADVTDIIFDADVAALYGPEFVPYLSKQPFSAFFAEGSEVNVRVAGKIAAAPVLKK